MNGMRVIIITGTPGSGKSSVAEALAKRLDRAAHIPVDFFRKMIKGGYRSPHHWDDEVDSQYKIARRAAGETATRFAIGGFIPILDDVVAPGWEEEWRFSLDGFKVDIVQLRPPLEVALERNQTRSVWTVDEKVLSDLHAMLGQPYTENWTTIDNSTGTVDDAVNQIIAALGL